MLLKFLAFAFLIGFSVAAPVWKRQVSKETLSEAIQGYLKLSPDRQAVYRQYFNEDKKQQTEEEVLREAVAMRLKDPDIYEIFHTILTGLIRDVKSVELRTFLGYYFDRLDEVKDNSDEEFAKYKQDIRAKWQDVGDDAKDELNKKFPGTAILLARDS